MLKPSVQVHNQDGLLIAEFWDCWRLDPAPVQDLRTRYEAHLRQKGRPEIVIDLSGVGFAGSAALGNFVSLQRDARRSEGRLIFCNVEPTVREVFRASRLEPLFEFAADRAAALNLIAKGRAVGLPDGKVDGDPDAPASQARPARSGGGIPSPLRRRKHESESQ
jgi:anti-anti-sigma factor